MESSSAGDTRERPPLPPWARPPRDEPWFVLPFRWLWALRWYAFELMALVYAIFAVACPLMALLNFPQLYTPIGILVAKLDRPEYLIPGLFDRFSFEFFMLRGDSSRAIVFQLGWIVLTLGAVAAGGALLTQLRHEPWTRRKFRIAAMSIGLSCLILCVGSYLWLLRLGTMVEPIRGVADQGFLALWLLYGAVDTAVMFAVVVWAKRGTYIQFLSGASVAFVMVFVMAFAERWFGARSPVAVAVLTAVVMLTLILGLVSLVVPSIGLPVYVLATYFGVFGAILALPDTSMRALTVAKLFGIALFAAALLNTLVKRQKLNVTYADLGIVFYFAVIVISYFFAEDKQFALYGARIFGGYVVIWFLLRITCTNRRVLRAVAWAMVLGAGMAASFSFFTFVTSGSAFVSGVDFRASGVEGDANTISVIAVLSIPLGIALFESARSGVRKVLLLTLIVLLSAMPFIAASRGGMVCFVLAMILMMAARRRFDPRTFAGVAAVGVFMVAMFFLLPSQYTDRLLRLNPQVSTASRNEADLSAQNRVELMRAAMYMFAKEPIIGVGCFNFGATAANPEFHGPRNLVSFGQGDRSAAVHNIYAGVLAEMGLVGFAGLIAIIVLAWRHTARARRDFAVIGDRRMARLADAFQVNLFVLLVFGLFYSYERQRLFWIILALCLSVGDVARRMLQERHGSMGR